MNDGKNVAIKKLYAFNKEIPLMLERAKAVNAPIGQLELRNIKGERWHQSPMGQTYAPPKVLKDLRSGSGISLAQAKSIVKMFERQAAEGGVAL